MPLITLKEVEKRTGLTRDAINKIIRRGKELSVHKLGRSNAVDELEFNNWYKLKNERTYALSRDDFLEAFKFALKINYTGHTRTDFGTVRQRPFMQAVENWTQGALAEIAFKNFLLDKFGINIRLEFKVYSGNIAIGQDIVEVQEGKTIRPPRKFISVKSGKPNAMFMIVPIREVEVAPRLSDYYVFVRTRYPVDTFARLYKNLPELSDINEMIPDMEDIEAEIVGYCERNDLMKRMVPEAGIEKEKYIKETGLLRKSDEDWKAMVSLI